MKIFILTLVLLWNAVAYSGDPYIKTFHKGKNWTVLQAGIAGELKQCVLMSTPHYIDEGKNSKYGTTHLEFGYPSNNVTFLGENIGMYFKIARRVTLQVGEGKSFVITPGAPVTEKSIVDNILSSKESYIKVNIDFGSGDPGLHTFSTVGFADAYKKLPACSGISSARTKDEPPPQGSKTSLTLDSFLTSEFARQYRFTKQGGRAVDDGSFENDLSVSGLRVMLGADTKGSNVVGIGLMFLGTSSLDSSKMSFVLELLKNLDPNTAQLQGIRDGIFKSLSKRVSQIDLAPSRTYGKLQVRAANVGGDAVISIKLQ
jgi:hypothetical protein